MRTIASLHSRMRPSRRGGGMPARWGSKVARGGAPVAPRAVDAGEVAIEELAVARLRVLGGTAARLGRREEPRVVDGDRGLRDEAREQHLILLAEIERRVAAQG